MVLAQCLSGAHWMPFADTGIAHPWSCSWTSPWHEPGCLLASETKIKHAALVLQSSSLFSSTRRLHQTSLISIILCNCAWTAGKNTWNETIFNTLPPHSSAAPYPCLYRGRTKQDSAKCLKCHRLLFSYFYTDVNALQDVTSLLLHPNLWKLPFKKRGRKSCLTLPLNVSQP